MVFVIKLDQATDSLTDISFEARFEDYSHLR